VYARAYNQEIVRYLSRSAPPMPPSHPLQRTEAGG
jgi:hypothetical protein